MVACVFASNMTKLSRRIKVVKKFHRFLKWLKTIFHIQPTRRNILLESCLYDSEKAEKEFENYKKESGLSTLEIACGIKPKK